MPIDASLSTIIALARAGALDHAWGQFSAAGLDCADDDPAALTVKGRLLKDYALRAQGEEERRRYYLQSAEAYRRSAALRPGTYALINAATLALLSGDRALAEQIAGEVLERIAREPDEPETPYYRAATEAEALLLLGRDGEARAALEAAMAAAPRAWEDHGSTLRQFAAIQEIIGGDTALLELLRPPRSLFYSGRGAGASELDADALVDAVARLIGEERIGFAYGGLAAGAELLAAETLLARGVELHVVLPSDAASYAACFVDPAGEAWHARFEAALRAAETVELVRPLQTVPDGRMAALAEEVARGAAMLNAERLMSEAVALRLGDGEAAGGIRTHVVPAPSAPVPAEPDDAGAGTEPRRMLLALLAVGVGGGAEEGYEDRLEDVGAVLAEAGTAEIAPHLGGDCILIGYKDPGAAAAAARIIHARMRGRAPLRIAGHYGLVACVRDPFTGALRPTESGAAMVGEIAGAIPPDTICISHDFAAVLAALSGEAGQTNCIGELQAFDGGSPIGLYALRPAAYS
jgi:hypothetical protein